MESFECDYRGIVERVWFYFEIYRGVVDSVGYAFKLEMIDVKMVFTFRKDEFGCLGSKFKN